MENIRTLQDKILEEHAIESALRRIHEAEDEVRVKRDDSYKNKISDLEAQIAILRQRNEILEEKFSILKMLINID